MTTDAEKLVLDRLAQAIAEFNKLPREHPDEIHEFRDAIHRAQDLVAVRVARRADPDTWPTYQ